MDPILILTRPEPEARAFAAEVDAALGRRLDWLHAPAFVVEDVDFDPGGRPGGVLFTSANAVARAPAGWRGLPAFCVGDRTAEAARAAGFAAVSAGGDAEDLVAMVIAARPDAPLVHLSGEETRGDLSGRLRAAGIGARRVIVYRQRPLAPGEDLRRVASSTRPAVAAVFSPRSASVLTAVDWTAPLHGVAMSPAVAEALAAVPCRTMSESSRPDRAAMLDATLLALGGTPLEGRGRAG